jgi:porin
MLLRAARGAELRLVDAAIECDQSEMGVQVQKRLVARCLWVSLALLGAQAARADPDADPEAGPESTTPHIPRPAAHNLPEAIDASIVYTFDIWHNSRGGLQVGTRYLDNLDLTVKVDADRAFGWQGATLFVYGLYNDGVGMSRSLVGNFQDSSNIETQVRAARLYEAWIDQKFAADKASVKIGLFDLNSEFDVQETGALFVTASHGIGPDFSQSGKNGPSIFPVTSLAVRGDYRISNALTVRAAVLDGVPGDPDHPKRLVAIDLGNGDGALLVGEVQYQAGRTRAVLGGWNYTARFDDLVNGARAGEDVEIRGNHGAYVTVERQFVAASDTSGKGLRGWLRFGVANDRLNPLDRYLGGGLVYTGPFKGRSGDQVGIALADAHWGEPYRQSLKIAGKGSKADELVVETSYRAVMNRWLTFQPDVQYIVNPGAKPQLHNALLFGLRTQIGF